MLDDEPAAKVPRAGASAAARPSRPRGIPSCVDQASRASGTTVLNLRAQAANWARAPSDAGEPVPAAHRCWADRPRPAHQWPITIRGWADGQRQHETSARRDAPLIPSILCSGRPWSRRRTLQWRRSASDMSRDWLHLASRCMHLRTVANTGWRSSRPSFSQVPLDPSAYALTVLVPNGPTEGRRLRLRGRRPPASR